MATWTRCKADITVSVGDRVEHLWPGLVVNLAREVAPGVTLAAAVAGREDAFEAADDPTVAPTSTATRLTALED